MAAGLGFRLGLTRDQGPFFKNKRKNSYFYSLDLDLSFLRVFVALTIRFVMTRSLHHALETGTEDMFTVDLLAKMPFC